MSTPTGAVTKSSNTGVLNGSLVFPNGAVSGDGSGLTGITASGVSPTSGNNVVDAINNAATTHDIADDKLTSNVALLNGNNTFTGTDTFNNPINGSGANLTNLNASNISSGTISDSRLSTNIPLLNSNNVFNGQQIISDILSPVPSRIFGNDWSLLGFSKGGYSDSNDIWRIGKATTSGYSDAFDIQQWDGSGNFVIDRIQVHTNGNTLIAGDLKVIATSVTGPLPAMPGDIECSGSFKGDGSYLSGLMTSNQTGTITFNSNSRCETIYNSNAATIANATITLPTTNAQGQIIRYVTKGAITSVTISGSVDIGAAVTTLAANSSIAYQSISTNGHWIRIL